MGSETSGPSSRPPKLDDLVSLCKSLNEEGVSYVIIGGFAMILQGYTRATMDVDLLVDPSPANIRKIKKALSRLPDNAASEMIDTDVERYQVVRVADEFVVDLLSHAGSVGISQALPHIDQKTINGVAIPVLDIETLILTKDTVRPKDKQDILFLRMKLKKPSSSDPAG